MAKTVIHISVEELKANAGDLLKRLEESPHLEFVVTRNGKPCARLVRLAGEEGKAPPSERVSLRGTWSHLPDLSDEDFAEAKRIWEPKIDD
jgi:antitoxin (DNA-binding transcriptional repressor) of toxin-antitoxin stability system